MPADNDSQSTNRSGRRADPMAEHKRRARWRLLGAIIILAAVGAIAPFFLEEQARPLSQDLLIEIPSRNSLFTKIDKLTPAESTGEPAPVADGKPQEPEQKSGAETAAPPLVVAPAAPKASVPPVASSTPAAKPAITPATTQVTPPTPAPAATSAASSPSSAAAPQPSSDGNGDAAKKPGKGFLVQVGVYSKADAAKAVQAKLTLGGHKVWLEPMTRDDGTELYRVRIGPFETREQAIEVRDRAKTQGYTAIVVVNP